MNRPLLLETVLSRFFWFCLSLLVLGRSGIPKQFAFCKKISGFLSFHRFQINIRAPPELNTADWRPPLLGDLPKFRHETLRKRDDFHLWQHGRRGGRKSNPLPARFPTALGRRT
jgi:hypothetical protein